MDSSLRNIIITLIIILISIGIVFFPFIPISVPVQEPYQVAIQVPYQVPYQELVTNYFDVQYTMSKRLESTGILDWELIQYVTINNVDNQGGPFTVSASFLDVNSVAYRAPSQTKYIGPGQSIAFIFQSAGLSYSTDWTTRYRTQNDISTPKKEVTTHITKTRTEYRTDWQTQYKTVYSTKHTSIAEIILASSLFPVGGTKLPVLQRDQT